MPAIGIVEILAANGADPPAVGTTKGRDRKVDQQGFLNQGGQIDRFVFHLLGIRLLIVFAMDGQIENFVHIRLNARYGRVETAGAVVEQVSGDKARHPDSGTDILQKQFKLDRSLYSVDLSAADQLGEHVLPRDLELRPERLKDRGDVDAILWHQGHLVAPNPQRPAGIRGLARLHLALQAVTTSLNRC